LPEIHRTLIEFALRQIPEMLERQLNGVTHGTWDENFPGAGNYITRAEALAANAQSIEEVESVALTVGSHAEYEIRTGHPAFGSATTPEQARNNYALAQEYMIVAPLARLALAKMKVHGQRWILEGIYDHAIGYTDEFRGEVGPVEFQFEQYWTSPGDPVRFLLRSLTGEQRASLIENFREGSIRKSSQTIEELCRSVVLQGVWKPREPGEQLEPYFSVETITKPGLSFMWQTAHGVLLCPACTACAATTSRKSILAILPSFLRTGRHTWLTNIGAQCA
jgi:hypothetical protein